MATRKHDIAYDIHILFLRVTLRQTDTPPPPQKLANFPGKGSGVNIFSFAGHTQCRHHGGRGARDNTHEPDFVAIDSYLTPRLQFADSYFRTVIVFRRVISGKFHSFFSRIFHSLEEGNTSLFRLP